MYRPDNVWAATGARAGAVGRWPVTCALVPEPTKPADRNAIAVFVGGRLGGYLSREDAERYGPGIRRQMAANAGALVAFKWGRLQR